MKENEIVRIEPNLHLNHINVFDIGANKDYFNKGLIQHELRNTVPEQLQSLFKTEKQSTINIPGYVIEQLAAEHPESLAQLQQHVKTNNISLATQPYFGTSMHILTEKDAITHILQHQELLKKTFGKQATIAILDKQPTKTLLKAIHCKKAIVTPQEQLSEMQTHLKEELQSFQTHVKKTEDSLLLQDFHLLANPQLLQSIHPDKKENEHAYEQYSTMLTILNDIAHRINTVRLSEEGKFKLETELSDMPSTLLQ